MQTPPRWPDAPPPVEPVSFRRMPLAFAALAFCLGDLLAQRAFAFRPTISLLTFALLLIALILGDQSIQRCRLGGKASRTLSLLPTLTLWLLTGFWSAELQPAPSPQTALIHFADGLSRTVRGRITRIRELPPRAPEQNSEQNSDTDSSEWDEPEALPTLSVDLALDYIEDLTPDTSTLVPIAGGVRITLTGPAPRSLQCGDRIEAPIRLRTPERYHDPGAWQYADYLTAQNIAAHASLAANHLVVIPAPSNDTDLHCRLYAAQTWAADRLIAFVSSHPNHLLPAYLRLTPDDAGMLNAMLFGDRERLNHALRLGFERTGSFHLFVVSGMHVALLAGALFYLARRLRLPPAFATILTIAAASVYALLTGFGAPVQRALLMASIFLIARLLARDRNVLNALGAAVLGVLILSPSTLFEAGFQMTFLAILAIAGLAIPLGEWSFLPYARASRKLDHLWLDLTLHPRLAQFRILLRIWGEHLQPLLSIHPRPGAEKIRHPERGAAQLKDPQSIPLTNPAHSSSRTCPSPILHLPAALTRTTLYVLELLLVGLIAETIMVLPMALYFHRATLFALPANVFSIPLIAVLAPLALVTFLLTLISPWMAVIPAAATAAILHTITSLIARISHLQIADWRVPGPSIVVTAAAIVCWIACCYAVRRSRRSAWITAAALPLIAAFILWPEPPVFTPATLEVTAIDVGQGDSILLVSPKGRTMLIDAGGPVGQAGQARAGNVTTPLATTSFDIGEDVVSPYLWSRRIRRLDIVALTHAHSDHMGGMPAILRNFRPRELWVSIDPGSSAYTALLKEAASLNITVRHIHAGDTLALDQLHIAALAPALAYANPGAPRNNDSLVLRVDYGLASVLLEGDAEAPSERAMLAAGDLHPVTLLKVGHHGSRTSTTPDFLAALAPRMAIVSVGRNNTFGHPRPEVLTRIADAHALVYRTDRFGLTQFLLTADSRIRQINSEP